MRRHRTVILILVLFIINQMMSTNGVSQAQGLSGKEIRRFGNGTARAMAWSPDSKQLVVGGSLGLWFFTPDLKLISHLDNNDSEITALAWSPNGRQIATASYARNVQLWDLASGQFETLEKSTSSANNCPKHAWNCDGWLGSVSFSPDGSQLAGASVGGMVDIWDTSTGKLVRSLKIDGLIYSVAWNPKDTRIAVGGENDQYSLLQVWDAKSGQLVHWCLDYQLIYEPGFVSVVQWINDGASVGLLSQTGNGIVLEWEPGDKPLLITGDIGGSAQDVLSFAPDRDVYALSRMHDSVSIPGYVESGIDVCCRVPNGGTRTSIGRTKALAWRPDARYLAYIDGDGAIYVIDTTANVDQTWLFRTVATLQDFESVPAVLGWDKDGHLEFVTDSWSNLSLGEWYLSTLHVKDMLTDNTLREWAPLLTFMTLHWALSPDKNALAIVWGGKDDKVAVLAPTHKGDEIFHMIPFEPARGQPASGGEVIEISQISRLYWSWDSARIAVLGASRELAIWDARTGKRLVLAWVDEADDLSWSPDGRYLAGNYDDSDSEAPPFILDVATGKVLYTLDDAIGKTTREIIWEPRGRNVAIISKDNSVRIWSTASGKLLQTLPGHTVEWSHDGKHLAIATEARTVELYDTQTGQVVVMLKGSTATTNRTAFSPDDREITTADDDGSIRVWNAATGKLLATLVGHKGGVKSVIWKSDGSQFLSYGDDSTWRLWSLSAR